MRLFSATLISLAAICLGFSAVVFILTFVVSRVDPSQGLEERIRTGLAALALGVVLLGIGVLLSRLHRRAGDSIRTRQAK